MLNVNIVRCVGQLASPTERVAIDTFPSATYQADSAAVQLRASMAFALSFREYRYDLDVCFAHSFVYLRRMFCALIILLNFGSDIFTQGERDRFGWVPTAFFISV